MSGTCAFLLKSALSDLQIKLDQVSCLYYDQPRADIYLGLESGEIILLRINKEDGNISMEPGLLLSPGFEASGSKVIAMHIAKTPLANLTDASEFCLLTIHENGKIRLWDTVDGKCFAVSSDNKFHHPQDIIKIGIVNDTGERFLFALERTGYAYFIDLWVLRTHEINASDRVPISGVFYDKYAYYALDKDEKIKIFEMIGLNSEMLFNYKYFMSSSEEMEQIIKGYEKLDVQEACAPLRQFEMKVTDSTLPIINFENPPTELLMDDRLVYFVYRKKLVVYLREELLDLKNIKGFDQMKDTRSQYHYIVADLSDRNREIEKSCLTKEGSLLIFLDNLDYFSICKGSLTLIVEASLEGKAMNINTKTMEVRLSAGSSAANVTINPKMGSLKKFLTEDHSSWDNLRLIFEPEDEFSFLFDLAGNKTTIIHLSEDPSLTWEREQVTGSAYASVGLQASGGISFGASQEPSPVEALQRALSMGAERAVGKEGLEQLFEGVFEEDEKVTQYLYAPLSSAPPCLVLCTSHGHTLFLPVFLCGGGDLSIYMHKSKEGGGSLSMHAGRFYVGGLGGRLTIIDFDAGDENNDQGHQIIQKVTDRKEIGEKELFLKKISKKQVKSIQFDGKVEKILPIAMIGENPNCDKQIEDFAKKMISLILDNNQIIILDTVGFNPIFQRMFGEHQPVGVYYDRDTEYLNILDVSGDIDVFNFNLGNLISMLKHKESLKKSAEAENLKLKEENENSDLLSTEDEDYDPDEGIPASTVFEISLFISCCLTYERSYSLSDENFGAPLNLVSLLKDYRETYVDLRSFTKFTSQVLLNVTQSGSIFEFCSQFYTNELLLSHIEYPALKTGALEKSSSDSGRPIPLYSNLAEAEEPIGSPKKQSSAQKKMDEAFGNLSSLQNLGQLLEMQQKLEKEQQAERDKPSESIPMEKIPLKLKNVTERNLFCLIKERLEDEPLEMLKLYEETGRIIEDKNLPNDSRFKSFDLQDVIKMITYLNYANSNIFVDPEGTENCLILKKEIMSQTLFFMNFYPPIFEPGKNVGHKTVISTTLFPQKLDMQSGLEFKAAFGDNIHTVDFSIGTQGLSESFSFVLQKSFIQITPENEKSENQNTLSSNTENKKGTKASQRIATSSNKIFTISRYVTTSIFLSIVSELIFLLKKGYQKVQPLLQAIRHTFFEQLPQEVPGCQPVSQKILTLMTLNDKLLVSASAHFILNNIYDQKRLSKNVTFYDHSITPVLGDFYAIMQRNLNFKENEPLSILNSISKFELFVISMLLFEQRIASLKKSSSRVGSPTKKPEETQPQTLEGDLSSVELNPLTPQDTISMLYNMVEIKIAMSYPFLTIPVIKICLETLPLLNIRSSQKIVRKLFQSVAYFSLYYGLTFEAEDPDNPTYVNSNLMLEENLSGIPQGKQIKSFVQNLSQQSYDIRRGIRVHTLKLLKLLAEQDTEMILYLLNETISSSDVTKLIAFNVVDIIKYMIKICETDFNLFIVSWAEILLKSLNPNKPEVRKFCQRLSTSAMKSLLKRFTFCAFHKETQHFFVPGPANEIVIYDLRTAMRWKSLKGHEHLVEGLAVQDSGQLLASFCRVEKNIKLWKIGNSGFFENLLKNSTELQKSIKIKEELPQGVEIKINWKDKKNLELSSPKIGWRLQVAI